MKTETALIIGACAVGGIILLSPKLTNKITGNIGTSSGVAVANLTSKPIASFTQQSVNNILIEPYEWALNYPGYIPIIDDAAKGLISIKKFGNPDKWFS
jgi:hypothetical protein